MIQQYQSILDAIVDGDDIVAPQCVQSALDAGLPPLEILHAGVVAGIARTGELWAANRYFLPDVILSVEAFKAAMAPLQPRLEAVSGGGAGRTFVLGVVHGDVHDLGKSLVAAMLQASGFRVVDLGINVPAEQFLAAVHEHRPAILGLGAYMTTTMLQMRDVISELERQGLRESLRVMVGGVPTSQEFAEEIGADAWGRDALDAAQKALQLVGG
ncbi:MAG TPA: corrinoid protein [Anaerolineae bacterium]|nr:corrinoid protein [Anaerolineae bacterium]